MAINFGQAPERHQIDDDYIGEAKNAASTQHPGRFGRRSGTEYAFARAQMTEPAVRKAVQANRPALRPQGVEEGAPEQAECPCWPAATRSRPQKASMSALPMSCVMVCTLFLPRALVISLLGAARQGGSTYREGQCERCAVQRRP
jgi:hypothetical protein